MGSHPLLQGIFPTQGSNPGFPPCRQILYQMSHKGSPYISHQFSHIVVLITLLGEGSGTPLQYSCLENPWTEEPGRLQSTGSQRVDFVDFPGGSDGKAFVYNVGNLGSIPGLVRSPGEKNGYPLQYSCLENSMDRGAWQATVHGSQRVRHN